MTELKTLKDIEVMKHNNPMGLSDRIKQELRDAAKEWVDVLRRAATRGEPIYPPCFHKEHDKYLSNWQEVYLSMATLLEHIYNLEET
ncbi:MAG: hypothetical protein KAS32_13750 [Candidatus Peribacteraceae bacterium]|nr:hypothetical protein [Candidatus Peribacteraceae bacterium]